MKKIFVRIGKEYDITNENYIKLVEAIKDDNSDVVASILENAENCDEVDRYLSTGCDDNPNDIDYDF